MTGIPEFNFPAFFEAERNIKRVGWYAVNPAALDVAAGDGGPGIEPQPHEHYMRRDLPHLWRCSDIGVLPGWWQSRGARIEVATALAIGLSVIDAETLMPMERAEVVETLIRTRRPEFIV